MLHLAKFRCGQESPKMYIWSTSPGDSQTPCIVCLASVERCPKLMKRPQPLVSRSSPYCEDTWRRYCCLTSFFQLSIHALVAKIWPHKVVRWCAVGDFFVSFLRPVFPASLVQHISDMHSKFALGPHHV